MILSILVPTMPKRVAYIERMYKSLGVYDKNVVEVIKLEDDGKMSTGKKRNLLLEMAQGKYVVFVDDDDYVTRDYISSILKAAEQDPDAIGFKGIMTTDGKRRQEFRISKNFKYEHRNGVYYRYNNHLSPVKREHALAIKFPDITFGEDSDYAKRLHQSGLIQKEVYIDRHLYHYDFRTNKK